MSQPLPNAMNYPKTEHNESYKVQEQVSSSEVIRPFLDGTNSPPVGYSPRPPLTRIDSRNSFQIRPGFPNPQVVPIRPPGQQIRPPPPGTAFVQRPPGLPTRPPFQQPFPNNQGNPNTPHQQLNQIRQGAPSIRPGGPFPPRGLGPGPRPPGLIQQKSESATDQKVERENFARYQSMDSTEARNVASPNQIVNNPDISNMNMVRSNSAKSASNSLHSSNSNLNEEINRSLNRNGSVEEKHRGLSNSQESLDRKSEHEYPSRPESRSSVKMDQIMEDANKPKIFSRPPSSNEILPQRPDSRNSVNYKPPSPHSPNPNKNSNEENQMRPIRTPTPIIDSEKIEPELPNKSSLQLKNLTKAKSPVRIEGDNDSGVDESTQGNDQSSNGDASSPRKSASKPPKRISSTTPSKNRSLSRESKSPSLKSPDSTATTPGTIEKKKLPMNKVLVGSAPSPNLKEVRSKIGSLQNSTYKPGGGNVKIENKKIERKNVTPRIEAKNEAYTPRGGDKKIISQKLQWNAKSKIGSLENANHKPLSSGKKIETVKLDFKEKAKPKVGSKDNIKHIPGGGDVKNEEDIADVRGPIDSKKIEFQVQSKIGSLDNVKHKPKGGEKKIFDDKDYLRQMSAISSENQSLSGSQMSKSADAIPRDCFSSLDYRPRHLETVKEEISIAESRPSSRLSRSHSARLRSASTTRPRWRY